MSQTPLTENLDIIQRSDLQITLLEGDLNIIQKLDDEPNDVGGLSAQELKERFDRAGNIIKDYINGTLVPELLAADAVETQREANETARQAQEAERETAETARAAAETQRQTAEGARAAAESARETAFDEAQGSRAEAFTQAQAQRAAVFAEGEEARNFWEDYDPTKAYVPGNKVYYLGSSYVNTTPCTDVLPTVEAHWQLIAKKGADSDEGMSQEEADLRYLQLTGGVMTGALKVPPPAADENPATKRYVDEMDGDTLNAAKAYADGKTAAYGYSKEETLKAGTRAVIGVGSGAVPDEALCALGLGDGPVGEIMISKGSPSRNWLYCNGDIFKNADYPDLPAVLPTHKPSVFYSTNKTVKKGNHTILRRANGYWLFVAPSVNSETKATIYYRNGATLSSLGNWSSVDVDLPGGQNYWIYDITFFDGYWCFSSFNNSHAVLCYSTSLSSGTWAQMDLQVTSPGYCLATDGSTLAIGINNSKILTLNSINGSVSTITLPIESTTEIIDHIEYLNGLWVIQRSNFVLWSRDLVTFNQMACPVTALEFVYRGIGYGNGEFILNMWYNKTSGGTADVQARTQSLENPNWTVREISYESNISVGGCCYADGYCSAGMYYYNGCYPTILYERNYSLYRLRLSSSSLGSGTVYISPPGRGAISDGVNLVMTTCVGTKIFFYLIKSVSGIDFGTLPKITDSNGSVYIKAKKGV